MSGARRRAATFSPLLMWAVVEKVRKGDATGRELAQALGIHHKTVEMWLRAAKLDGRVGGIVMTPARHEAAKRLWAQGMTAKQVADEIGVGLSALMSHMHRHRADFERRDRPHGTRREGS